MARQSQLTNRQEPAAVACMRTPTYRKPCSPRPVGMARGPAFWHGTARWPAGPCRHGPMDQAMSGPPPWPVARPGHGTVVQAGTVMAQCPIWPSSLRRPATANISAAQEARSPARLPPIPHSLPASPIPNPNPHSLSLARSLSLCSRSRSTAATAIGPVLSSGDLAGAPPLHLANPVIRRRAAVSLSRSLHLALALL